MSSSNQAPAAIRRPPTARKWSWKVPSAPSSSNSRRNQVRLCSPPGVGGKSPWSPQRFWWRSTKASRSATGSVERSRRTSPAASARRSLRRTSWRSFLGSVPRYPSKSVPASNVTTGQTSSRSRTRVQPAPVRRAEGVGQRDDRGIAAAEAPQVDDVPGGRVVGVVGAVGGRQGVRQGFGHRREVVRPGQDRRVVGVVAGPEEDRLRRRGDGRRGHVRHAAEAGPEDRVVGLHLVAVHERHDRDGRPGVGRRRVHHDQRLFVGVRAVGVPPGAVDPPAGEGGRPRAGRGQGVPGRRVDGLEGPADGTQGPWPGACPVARAEAPGTAGGRGGSRVRPPRRRAREAGCVEVRGGGVIDAEDSTGCVRNSSAGDGASSAAEAPRDAVARTPAHPARGQACPRMPVADISMAVDMSASRIGRKGEPPPICGPSPCRARLGAARRAASHSRKAYAAVAQRSASDSTQASKAAAKAAPVAARSGPGRSALSMADRRLGHDASRLDRPNALGRAGSSRSARTPTPTANCATQSG